MRAYDEKVIDLIGTANFSLKYLLVINAVWLLCIKIFLFFYFYYYFTLLFIRRLCANDRFPNKKKKNKGASVESEGLQHI